MDFLWHKVSEKEKEDIKKQAKKIMDDFSEKLAELDKQMKEPEIVREESEREEGREKLNIDRKTMFDNAPDKDDDFIIAEKGEWK
jgi:Asp-tRNA(Asn)/Glu-tRNA(Gln) amidotransferase C subunit